MVGGLILSQMMTLFTTPVIYVYLDRVASYFAGGRHELAAAVTPENAKIAAE